MVDFNKLREDVYKQLEKCDPFFKKHRALVFMYIYYVCDTRLGKIKYDCDVKATEKGDIMVEFISIRKRVMPIVITKNKIKRHAKLYELPE